MFLNINCLDFLKSKSIYKKTPIIKFSADMSQEKLIDYVNTNTLTLLSAIQEINMKCDNTNARIIAIEKAIPVLLLNHICLNNHYFMLQNKVDEIISILKGA